MRLTPRDDAGLIGGKAPAGESAAGRHQHAPIAANGSSRHRYVVGIFGQPSGAYGAIKDLSQDTCDVLVLSDARPDTPKTTIPANGRVTVHHLDASSARAANLAEAFARFTPFATLKWGAGETNGHSPGLQRLFQNLVHHLAAGATVTIAHVPDSERQLQVSRALLEAKCDILLTHDVVNAADDAPPKPAHPDACCQNCTSKACQRIGEPQMDNAAHPDE